MSIQISSRSPMNELKKISVYIYVLYVVLCVLALIILGKVFYIQAIPNEDAQRRAAQFTYKLRDIEPERGRILAADGSPLSTSIPEYEIRWDSKGGYNIERFNSKLDSLCSGLSDLFLDRTAQEYKDLFLSAIAAEKKNVKVIDHINYNQLQKFKALPFVKEKKLRSGVIINPKDKRSKPYGALAARTIGIFRESNMVGLEASYDSLLRGKAGKQMQQKVGGDWMPMNGEYVVEPEPGFDVVTTLDVHLQDAAQSSLRHTMEVNRADWGCVILMEVKTGYIKALANLTYDSVANKFYEIENLALTQSVEPGSTMKLASLLAAMEEGNLDLGKVIHTGGGTFTIGNHTLRDVKACGSITLEQVFAKSSNVGTAMVVRDVFGSNPQKFLDYLDRFGYGQLVGIDLLGEGKSSVKRTMKDAGWSDLSLTQMAVGYEVQVTPLHQLCFYNAIANGGKFMKPRLVSEIRKNGLTYEKYEPVVIRENFLKPETIAKGRKLMEAVTTIGTGKGVFKHSPYRAAGKTGTARVFEKGRYLENSHRASFVGYFPAEDPKYSCIVVVNKARVFEAFGGKVAAPVFRDLANILFGTELDIPHNAMGSDSTFVAQPWIPTILSGESNALRKALSHVQFPYALETDAQYISANSNGSSLAISSKDENGNKVPDVRGMGLTDAVYVLEKRGLKVSSTGYGKVVSQSILPGTKANHQFIQITLR
jgi:cell division protein FtsI (penicillin-binding protein 3)